MRHTMYYVVDVDVTMDDTHNRILSGYQYIRLWKIVNDKPHLFDEFEITIDKEPITEIFKWFEENGYGSRDYLLERL